MARGGAHVAKRTKSRKRKRPPFPFPPSALVLVALIGVLVYWMYRISTAVPATVPRSEQVSVPLELTSTLTGPEAEPTPVPSPSATPRPLLDFSPWHTDGTDPKIFVTSEAIQVNGTILEEEEEYQAAEPIDFGYGDEYTDMQGVITFRGNNFRDGGSYGYANIREKKFGASWSVPSSTLTYQGETWSGSGWVGQPLLVKWPRETKAVMNMYDWAKENDELVEVIYATMDGNVYFLDLYTGKKTRDNLNLGFTFKGAGALDPRGYPILYLGAGYDGYKGYSRAFVISLLDFEILHSFGHTDVQANGGFSLRGNLSYFDGSPLVDAETDQLIYPGENGIIYIIKMNTVYDEAAGILTMDPETVKWRYYGTRTNLMQYWVGMESSPVIWRSRLIIPDNGGRLMCIDLNTLKLDWVQDILDDSNASPVLSIEDGHPYIYVSTSFHYGWRSYTTAKIPIFKIDAENGEIVWQKDYICYTEQGVSGGVQSTIALGKNELEGRIYVTVAKTDLQNNGVLACLDTETGEVLWEHKSYYTWSSPVLVYNEDGSGYVVYCNYGYRMYLLDALTGELCDTFNLQGGVEASPAVYENMLVVGTRKCLIWGVQLK